jgi:hypothetical protein
VVPYGQFIIEIPFAVLFYSGKNSFWVRTLEFFTVLEVFERHGRFMQSICGAYIMYM